MSSHTHYVKSASGLMGYDQNTIVILKKSNFDDGRKIINPYYEDIARNLNPWGKILRYQTLVKPWVLSLGLRFLCHTLMVGVDSTCISLKVFNEQINDQS